MWRMFRTGCMQGCCAARIHSRLQHQFDTIDDSILYRKFWFFYLFVDTSFAQKFRVLGHGLDSDFPEPTQFQCIGQSNKIYSSKERSKLYVLIYEMMNLLLEKFWKFGHVRSSDFSYEFPKKVLIGNMIWIPFDSASKAIRFFIHIFAKHWKGMTWWMTSPKDSGGTLILETSLDCWSQWSPPSLRPDQKPLQFGLSGHSRSPRSTPSSNNCFQDIFGTDTFRILH